MPLPLLTDELWFPPAESAPAEGLLAIGGDLRMERLLLAYRSGIFPWFNEDEPPLWWSPDPRSVLYPAELYISKSMRQLLRREAFTYTFNQNFRAVIHACGSTRYHQEGTWITPAMEQAYNHLHLAGYAVSAEAWEGNELAGGLYGVLLGRVFFGESMFSRRSNASKFAFIRLVQQLQQQGVVLIDCQVHNPHLESLGARLIPRQDFLALVHEHTSV
ncbi:MAG TPA: leucyl/phenylalanyl-tRNA--protein transferase [Lacibacter sp.]|nr:leucyl/phenylalanyl-tRNA--protein transferase [Lacibacter sp.]HMO90376.1 leucyl/phenylalanyl-tRNA--protein transferase [Lacibacter sp.]